MTSSILVICIPALVRALIADVGGPVKVADSFVDDIKAGEAAAPTMEDTMPESDN